MESLFGIPMDALMVGLLIAFALVMGTVLGLALRHPVLLKMGLRTIPRRRGRTVIIILGLMLGTLIIAAAFNTGDTMTHTVRSTALTSLGHIDEIISVKGTENGDHLFFGENPTSIYYFDQALFDQVREAAEGLSVVDGVAPVIMEPVALQDRTTRQNEPRAILFAADPARLGGFGTIRAADGSAASLADLGPGEVYLNRKAAEELNARPGDELLLFAAGQANPLRVKGIVRYQGTGTDGSAVLMPLDRAQQLLDREGLIKNIILSNRGDALGGVRYTDEVVDALEPVLEPLGLKIDPAKRDAVELANEVGSLFTSFFVSFGTFSIIAGILLIFMIFVMLAAERKPEMGMARAVGMKRHHLVQMFLFEGMLYDLVAAAIGAMLGLAVAYGMVFLMARAFATFGVEIKHDFRLRSLVVAYTLGVLLTFLVVTASAWRVSLLNIVRAIRNLPEQPAARGTGHASLLGALGLLLGLLLTVTGLNAQQGTPFFLGISFMLIGLVPLLRRLGLSDRLAYTLPAIALLLWWLLPFDTFDFILPEFKTDISMFIISGVMVVLGGTWIIMYNSDLLIRAIMALFGGIRWLPPVLKTAVAYPLTNRFRTGMTVTMFSLIVFTLVVMATLTNAFVELFNDEEAFGGGFDIRATTVRINPVEDMEAALGESDLLDPRDFSVVASQSFISLEARQVGIQGQQFESYPVRGLDENFLLHNAYGFAAMAEGYDSPREVWRALAENPGLAVVDPIPVPRREKFGFEAGQPKFRLQGFYIEDRTFSPVEVEVHDPQTDKTITLTIIGVLKDTIPEFMLGISTSQRMLAEVFGEEAQPTIYFFKLAEGVDARRTAEALESAFLMNGMEADVLKEEMEQAVGTRLTFNYILQGFTGLGLVIGVAALGVISARAVVERRQEIGVLRALGFQRSMVQLSFLLESSFVAILGIALGFVLGLILSYNIVQDSSEQGSTENIRFAVPWLNLAAIFLITYVASVAMAYIPARQAARVYPAEALRYE